MKIVFDRLTNCWQIDFEMKPTTITSGNGMKSVIREYRGHIIESFNLSQLGDSEVRGMAYSVYSSLEHYQSGRHALSMGACLSTLDEAKGFIEAA